MTDVSIDYVLGSLEHLNTASAVKANFTHWDPNVLTKVLTCLSPVSYIHRLSAAASAGRLRMWGQGYRPPEHALKGSLKVIYSY